MRQSLSVACFCGVVLFTLSGTLLWGAAPPNNDVSDADENTAGGTGALQNNTTGIHNTAFGNEALLHNTSGEENTATGNNALGSNTEGTANTATGVSALSFNKGGSGNTAIGKEALKNNTSGSNNIALGVEAGTSIIIGSNNIDIGNDEGRGDSRTIRLGTNNVQTRTFIAGISGVTVGNASMVLITASGKLGTVLSSARYKQDIDPMGEQSRKLLTLRPVTFHYKQDPHGQRQYGLIAEEVAKVYPELVTRGTKGEVESVQYHELIPMLLNEVQHQQQELIELKAQNARLQTVLVQQNAALAARLERLEATAPTETAATH